MMAELCTDDELAYERSRTRFESGSPIHVGRDLLPRPSAPCKPRSPSRHGAEEGTYYEHGQHRRVYSLVPPVPQEALDGSRSYRQLEAELRDEPFASKIDVAPCRTATAQSSCDHLRIIVHGRASRDQSRDTTTAFGPRAGGGRSTGPVLRQRK